MDDFINHLIKKETVGYVLFGEKPVGFIGTSSPIEIEGDGYDESIKMLKGVRELQHNNLLDDLNKDYIFHLCPAKSHMAIGSKTLYVINKKQFHQVFEKNKTLFHIFLGPRITSEDILRDLAAHKSTYDELATKKNEILIGILLGYGTHNSSIHSRRFNLLEAEHLPENVPYASHRSNDLEDSIITTKILNKELILPQYEDLHPSYGFKSTQEEINYLSEKFQPLGQLEEEEPILIFGVADESLPENVELLKHYRNTQAQLQQLLKNENLTDIVLKVILKDNPFVLTDKNTKSKDHFDRDPNELVAYILSYLNSYKSKEYVISFVEGMRKNENGVKSEDLQIVEDAYNFPQTKYLVDAKEKLKTVGDTITRRALSDNYTQIVEGKLFYKKVVDGFGDPVDKSHTKVKIHFVVKSHDERVILDTSFNERPVVIELKNAIPGFSHGILGMQVGEVREIIIHPEFAYGMYSNFEPSVGIFATVKLLEVSEGDQKAEFPQLQNVDHLYLGQIADSSEKLYRQQEHDWATYKGFEFWDYYKKAKPLINLDEVIKSYEQMRPFFTEKMINENLLKELEDFQIYIYDTKIIEK